MPRSVAAARVKVDDALAMASDRRMLAVLAIAFLLWGCVVELRSALQEPRKGDLTVYLRAAWAVRASVPLGDITDHHGWHYNYPPLFAILLTPLADPPAGQPVGPAVPYPVSVAIWYLISLGCLWGGVSTLAAALGPTWDAGVGRSPPTGSRVWWAARVAPIVLCMAPIGHSLMRGQVDSLLFLLLAGGAAATLKRRRFEAGIWIACAVCLKLIPAFLLLLPVWRRDIRGLVGATTGLVIGLLVIPMSVMGPDRTLENYRSL